MNIANDDLPKIKTSLKGPIVSGLTILLIFLPLLGIWMVFSALEPDWYGCKKKLALRLLNVFTIVRNHGVLIKYWLNCLGKGLTSENRFKLIIC